MPHTMQWKGFAIGSLCLLGLAAGPMGVAHSQSAQGAAEADAPAHARAELQPTEGNTVAGAVGFTQTADGLMIDADLHGLEPGTHGLHIHETGDCSAPDASSAGGHMAPANDPHGAPDDPPSQRHAGDLGNITADADGTARKTLQMPELRLTEGDYNVVGRAVIVHSGADDLESQPSGDSGDRLACGVVRLVTDGSSRAAG